MTVLVGMLSAISWLGVMQRCTRSLVPVACRWGYRKSTGSALCQRLKHHSTLSVQRACATLLWIARSPQPVSGLGSVAQCRPQNQTKRAGFKTCSGCLAKAASGTFFGRLKKGYLNKEANFVGGGRDVCISGSSTSER
jgi:hypothetical protein